jgi:hypothetical protein
MTQRKVKKKLGVAWRLMRQEGFLETLIRSLQKVQSLKHSRTRQPSHKRKITMLAKLADIESAEWPAATPQPPIQRLKRDDGHTRTIVWIMSPPGESGGGHQNIFRFMSYLDGQGYRNIVYLYSVLDGSTPAEVIGRISHFYKLDKANVRLLDHTEQFEGVDALFATGWETAYPAYNAPKHIKKFYFVQDFEPLFYPMGSEYVLAENTYKFGFMGITAGRWLTTKLKHDYGMKCDFYEFGADTDIYSMLNKSERKEVFFYARPITARRGFELGILALKRFHDMHPEYIINLAGWDASEYDIPFPYVNHKALRISELSALYNRCAAALVLSLTNMSLLPLELLATGTIPVVNDAENNRLVSDNPYIHYAQPSPHALAQAMSEVVGRKDLPHYAEKASKSVRAASWDASGKKFVSIVEQELYE